ncbi:dGTP triphosphohydrolase [uncultured Clostridium sp.]|uniref:dGTP triphosphohydrolase n=1 Tax=uncultured Clostridium sp. TaxID=59620 RepID=UPI00258BEAE4|nr:dNTP triphosphohydrolase [uncultured Clostridium sp.]
MKYKLDWNKLLCGERERDSEKSFTEHRNEFDKDYDRIVYSSSIRRLQDKAQVFPLQENDFTRTRLTHSIEAAALARSLGAAIGDWLRRNGEFEEKQERELASLLQVAALIHDLGNPPFGHYGEDVIRKWFVEWFKSNEYKNIEKKLRLSENEEKDFINFEGNAQTLRIVTKLQMLNDQFGVNFTYATLATIMKYPWLSSFENSIKKNKFGYFNAEKKVVEKIYKCTGLEDEVRHPATFLLEAADDIAYLCADIEDSVKKGIINWEKEYTKIKYKLMNENKDYSNMFKKLDELNEKNIKNDIPEYELVSIQNFKVRAQGLMIKYAIESFKENYALIMNGDYKCNSLLDNENIKGLIDELKRIQKHCFVDKEVLTLELVGDKVISGLLDMFVNELVKCKDEPNSKKKSGKLYRLISDNFKYVCLFDYENNRKREFNELRVYDKILLITDFISGMTDSYAVKLYKELTGVKLP